MICIFEAYHIYDPTQNDNIALSCPVLAHPSHPLPSVSQRARKRFNQVIEAKKFEGVFLCRKVCWVQNSNS